MASRVNVKFVVLLATVLVLAAAGTGFLAYKVVFKTSEELARRGDAKMAEGDIPAAELLYSKAVNKDPYNSVYLLKWRHALESWTPETDRALETEFSTTYRQLHSQLARSDNMSHVEYQLEHLDLLNRWLSRSFSRTGYEMLASEADAYIRAHELTGPNEPQVAKLRAIRGRALGRISAENLALTPEQLEQAESDIAAALDADPSDYESLFTLIGLRQSALAKAEAAARLSEAERLRAELESTLSGFIETNGAASKPGTLASMLRTQDTMRAEMRATVMRLADRAPPELEKIRDGYQAETRGYAANLAALPPAEVDLAVLRRLFALEGQTNTKGDFESTLPLVESAAAREPDDLQLALLLGEVLAARHEYDRAISVLQGVLSTPRLPLGLRGWERLQSLRVAAFHTADYSLRARAGAEDPAVAASWLARAKEGRALLAQFFAEQSGPLQIIDAKLAVAEEDFATAQKLLSEYNMATGNQDREALWLSAQVAKRLRQWGNAKSTLEALLALNATDSAAHVALADVELSLNRPDAAMTHLQAALKNHPDDEQLANRIAELGQIIDPSKASDPVMRAVYQARLTADGSESQIADPAGAVDGLTLAIEELGDDPRLYAEKTRLQMTMDDAASAAETVSAGLAKFPDDPTLQRYQRGVTGAGSVDALIEMIRESDASEISKLVDIYGAYRNAGRAAEAEATLAQAEALEPDYPRLLDVLFSEAYTGKNLDRARVLAQRAQSTNADRMDGLTFRARLLMLEGKNDEALAALSQAVQRDANNASLWRLLGNLQVQQGRTSDAVSSFQRGLSIKPDDISTIIEYCGSLIRLNRMSEALEVARRSEPTARTNDRFMDLLLGLEAEVGDRTSARDRREKLLAARPNNLSNRHALVELYITLGERDKAMGLLADTREKFGQSDSLVQLEARWYADGNDLEAARKVFAERIAETPPAERMGKYIQLAQFMLGHGRTRNGIVALQQAAAAQPEGEHEVDLLLANSLMRFGRNSEGYEIVRKLIDAGVPDPAHTLKLQGAEALIAIDRLTDAESLLAGVPDADTNITAVLLRSRLQLKRGDGRAARATLDNAVSRWPSDYRVWILRAEAEATVPELREDALADLQQAITLMPALAEAHKRKAELLALMGREAEAIEAWREAVRLNPNLEELRSALLATMVQRGLETDALQMAQEWFDLRPRDIGLRSRVAELFVLGGMKHTAIQIYQDAAMIEVQPQVVLRLVDLLLGDDPPRAGDAERALSDAKTLVTTDPALLLARARVFALTNRIEAARNDCAASFRLLAPYQADRMAFWFSTLNRVFDDPQQTLIFLRGLAGEPGASEWAAMFSARVLMMSPENAAAGFAELQRVVSGSRDREVKYSGLRALAGSQYTAGEFEQAVASWKAAVELRPGDWQIENNIAYCLVADLKKPQEALPFAESAAIHAQSNPEVLDTLGVTYLALGRAEDALAPLEAAVVATRSTPQDAKYMVRLAQGRLAVGDTRGARDLVSQIQPLLDNGRELDDQYRAILEEVRTTLGEE
ncbi:MAG: tetratricopeptide repeat protein [Phycisphaerales bacterium]|nr:tetratricopeptide repeat protein [Phycisphaerales bacterium]